MKLVPALLTASLLSWCLFATMSQKAPARQSEIEATTSRLVINIVDAADKPVAARFTLTVDGSAFEPKALGGHGLRFVSVHESKRQVYPVTFARGTGPVEVALPPGAETVQLSVAKGFEYLPASTTVTVNRTGETTLGVQLDRWEHLEEKGWRAADAHVHYDRLAEAENRDWLNMLDADGLSHAFFMVLKGGKVPGIWARQYDYGTDGEASDGQRRLISGEEYRDSAMGHINLLGLSKVIQPISTGGLGQPKVHVNWPPLLDVLNRSREVGGLGGVAHGGSLGRHPTATADAVLDGVDFFEIGNAHLYAIELWYRLMNCGYNLPPAAGRGHGPAELSVPRCVATVSWQHEDVCQDLRSPRLRLMEERSQAGRRVCYQWSTTRIHGQRGSSRWCRKAPCSRRRSCPRCHPTVTTAAARV